MNAYTLNFLKMCFNIFRRWLKNLSGAEFLSQEIFPWVTLVVACRSEFEVLWHVGSPFRQRILNETCESGNAFLGHRRCESSFTWRILRGCWTFLVQMQIFATYYIILCKGKGKIIGFIPNLFRVQKIYTEQNTSIFVVKRQNIIGVFEKSANIVWVNIERISCNASDRLYVPL